MPVRIFLTPPRLSYAANSTGECTNRARRSWSLLRPRVPDVSGRIRNRPHLRRLRHRATIVTVASVHPGSHPNVRAVRARARAAVILRLQREAPPRFGQSTVSRPILFLRPRLELVTESVGLDLDRQIQI